LRWPDKVSLDEAGMSLLMLAGLYSQNSLTKPDGGSPLLPVLGLVALLVVGVVVVGVIGFAWKKLDELRHKRR
jgi:hypothetical protein